MNSPQASAQTAADTALDHVLREALGSAPPTEGATGFPRAWWSHLGRCGMLGLGFSDTGNPPAANAAQISALAGAVTHASHSLGLGMAWMMQQMLGRFVLAPHLRSDAQRALLASMARGETLLALAISEPGVGAHPKHLRTQAVQEGDHWVLDGHKTFVSNGPSADAIIVLAVSGERDGRKGFDAFVVDAHALGLTRQVTGKVHGLEPLGHCDLLLTGCRVSDSQRLGAPGQAFDTIARPVRAIEDALLLGPMLGAMQAELDALAHTLGRTLGGAPPAQDAVRELGALQLELNALSAVRIHAAQHLEQQGCDETLALLTAGARRLLERWQSACESFSTLQCVPDQPALARDLRLVLGIARGIAQSRQLQTGENMLRQASL